MAGDNVHLAVRPLGSLTFSGRPVASPTDRRINSIASAARATARRPRGERAIDYCLANAPPILTEGIRPQRRRDR